MIMRNQTMLFIKYFVFPPDYIGTAPDFHKNHLYYINE